MAGDPAADLHTALAAVAAHRLTNPPGGGGVGAATAMVRGDQLDEAAEAARHRFHAAGGTAEHADAIEDAAYSSVQPRSRLNEFHTARARGV